MSIETALIDISIAISAMNCTFVSPEMAAVWSIGFVISHILPAAGRTQPVIATLSQRAACAKFEVR
jgi:hypothetical protein